MPPPASTALAIVAGANKNFRQTHSTCWGVCQVDKETNRIYVENLKPRDFQPRAPFLIQGRPFIDETGDFGNFSDAEEFSAYKSGKRAEQRKSQEADRRRILAMVAEGKTQREIAAALGISQATVNRLLREV